MPAKPHKPNFVLILVILLLVVFGLVAVASASSVISFNQFGDNLAMLKAQLVRGVLIGGVLFIVCSLIPYAWWKRINLILLVVTLLLLVAVFIPHLGYSFGGAQRWIQLGPVLFQPSELAKLALVVFLAAWLDKRGKGIKEFTTGVVPFVVIVAVVSVLILMQPDLGTLTVIAAAAMAMFFAAGARLWHIGAIALAALAALALAIKIEPYRLARFTTFLNPNADPQGIGYQINQALLAVGSGGWFGQGLGQSIQKYSYLPEPAGDSIFAVMAEELGFVRTALVVFTFLLLAQQGYSVARRAPDNFAKLLAIGITTWFVAQAFINIGAIIGVLPLTGIPLPFVSYGGTALAVSLAAAGILVNVSRYAAEEPTRRRAPWSLRRPSLVQRRHAETGRGATGATTEAA
ncbi:MAG: putative lipid II flippase FtsW [Candidatus Andersenbacteria bacterium]